MRSSVARKPVRSTRTGATPAQTLDKSSRTAYAQAYEALRSAILAGAFRPGDVLTLRALVAKLGLGVMPIREALKRLTSDGAFEALPNRSARIPTLDRHQVEQLLELRKDLEGKAALLAAKNVNMTQIEYLSSLQQQMQACARKSDAAGYTALNMAFHFEIYRIADDPVRLTLIHALWLRMAPLVASTVSLLASDRQTVSRTTLTHHERILDAFRQHDPAAAELAMREDLITPTRVAGYWEALESAATAHERRRT